MTLDEWYEQLEEGVEGAQVKHVLHDWGRAEQELTTALSSANTLLVEAQEKIKHLESDLKWYKSLSQTDRSRAKLYLQLMEDLRNAYPAP